MTRGARLLVGFLMLSSIPLTPRLVGAQTIDVELCNEGSAPVRAALVHGTPGSTDFTSRGWVAVAPGRCDTLVKQTRVVYVAFAATDDQGDGLLRLAARPRTDLTAPVDLRFLRGTRDTIFDYGNAGGVRPPAASAVNGWCRSIG